MAGHNVDATAAMNAVTVETVRSFFRGLDPRPGSGGRWCRVDVGDAGLLQAGAGAGVEPRPERWTGEAAHTALSLANHEAALDGDDLEPPGDRGVLLGRVEQCIEVLRRAYQRYVDSGSSRRAVRCAFWLLFHLDNQGDFSQASS
jgi:hypothetical protein